MKNDPDWKGAIRKKFRWRHLKFEWGRWCYKTDCFGKENKVWWEWEDNSFTNMKNKVIKELSEIQCPVCGYY